MKIRRYQETELNNFGEQLRNARIEDGRSAQVLATLSEISMGYWYQLEKEEREWVSEEVIRRIEKVLRIDFGVEFE